MSRITVPLTDTKIKNAKPKSKEYNLVDGKGLTLRIMPSGSKKWLFNYSCQHEARAVRKDGNSMVKANLARSKASSQRALKVVKSIQVARQNGYTSLREIAKFLNTKTHIRTSRNNLWSATAVSRIIAKACD